MDGEDKKTYLFKGNKELCLIFIHCYCSISSMELFVFGISGVRQQKKETTNKKKNKKKKDGCSSIDSHFGGGHGDDDDDGSGRSG